MDKVSNNVNLKISLAHEWLDNLAVIHLIKDFVFDSENIKTGVFSKRIQTNAPIARMNTDYQTKYFGYNESA